MSTKMICEKCGESLNSCMWSALMADFGARLSWDPAKCPDGEEHHFIDIEEYKEKMKED